MYLNKYWTWIYKIKYNFHQKMYGLIRLADQISHAKLFMALQGDKDNF